MLAVLAGCSAGDGIRRGAVDGTVALDGSPIDDGVIRFVPTGRTTGAIAETRITGGRFSLPRKSGPCVGSQTVQIFGFLRTGRMVIEDGHEVEEIKQLMPPQFNAASQLTVTIQEGKNTLPFELSSRQ